jgi:hypothetical protein
VPPGISPTIKRVRDEQKKWTQRGYVAPPRMRTPFVMQTPLAPEATQPEIDFLVYSTQTEGACTQPWRQHLVLGISIPEGVEQQRQRENCASALVASQQWWTVESLDALAWQALISATDASNGDMPPFDAAAAFTQEVCRALKEGASEWAAEHFTLRLQSNTMDTFTAWWSAVGPSSFSADCPS